MAENMSLSDKMQESEESKVIIEKYRKKYLKSKEKTCCSNTLT